MRNNGNGICNLNHVQTIDYTLRLKDIREACGRSQCELANALNVSRSTLQRYERKKLIQLTVAEIVNAANCLGLSVNKVFKCIGITKNGIDIHRVTPEETFSSKTLRNNKRIDYLNPKGERMSMQRVNLPANETIGDSDLPEGTYMVLQPLNGTLIMDLMTKSHTLQKGEVVRIRNLDAYEIYNPHAINSVTFLQYVLL